MLKKNCQDLQFQKQGNCSQASQATTSKTDLCWYHAKFGSKATKCRQPCKCESENWLTSPWMQPTRLISPIYFEFFYKNTKQYFLLDNIKLTLPYELWTIQPSTLMTLINWLSILGSHAHSPGSSSKPMSFNLSLALPSYFKTNYWSTLIEDDLSTRGMEPRILAEVSSEFS